MTHVVDEVLLEHVPTGRVRIIRRPELGEWGPTDSPRVLLIERCADGTRYWLHLDGSTEEA